MKTPLEELQELTQFNQEEIEDMAQEKMTYARTVLAKIAGGDFGEASQMASDCFETINWDGD